MEHTVRVEGASRSPQVGLGGQLPHMATHVAAHVAAYMVALALVFRQHIYRGHEQDHGKFRLSNEDVGSDGIRQQRCRPQQPLYPTGATADKRERVSMRAKSSILGLRDRFRSRLYHIMPCTCIPGNCSTAGLVIPRTSTFPPTRLFRPAF